MMVDIFSSFDPATTLLFLMSPLMFWLSATMIFSSTFASMWPLISPTMIPLYTSINIITPQTQRSFMINLKAMSHLISALFMLIIFMNITGLFPYIFSQTGHLILTLSFGLPLWLSLLLSGMMWNTKQFLAHFLPSGAPDWLNPFLVLIETVSISVRFITLSFRLGANITAGHIVLGLMGGYCSAAMFSSAPSMMTILMTQSFFTLFEMGVALIQAYIFCLLLTLYSDDHPK
uniref:ATP synthase subunit a n=1 Tax=Pholoe pallida TaxID=328599 RepID=A0A343W6L0_9ANNE|nr:ATP synthase F0 subunit 6 [Pholoe pallida]